MASALLSPNTVFASCGDGSAVAWNLSNFSVLAVHRDLAVIPKRAMASPASATAFSSGSNCNLILLAGRDKASSALASWTTDDACVRSAVPEPLASIAVSADGSLVAGGGGTGRLYIWDAASGELLRSWTAHYKACSAVAFSPCSSILVSGGGDGIIHLWDVASCIDVAALSSSAASAAMPRPSHSWSDHSLGVTSLTFGPLIGGMGAASRLYSSSADRTVRAWDCATLKPSALLTLSFPAGVNKSIVDASEATLYSACEDGIVYCTALQPAALHHAVSGGTTTSAAATTNGINNKMVGHSGGGVVDIAITTDGSRLVSAGEDGTVRVFDTASRLQLTVLEPAKAVAGAVSASSGSSSSSSSSSSSAAATGGSCGPVNAILLGRLDRVTIAAPLQAPRLLGGAGGGGGGASSNRNRAAATQAAAASAASVGVTSASIAGGAVTHLAPLKKFPRPPASAEWQGSATGPQNAEAPLAILPVVADESSTMARTTAIHTALRGLVTELAAVSAASSRGAASVASSSSSSSAQPALQGKQEGGEDDDVASLKARITALESENARWKAVNNKLMMTISSSSSSTASGGGGAAVGSKRPR